MPAFQRAVLISDLHLCESRPDILRAFYAFLDEVAPRYEALFVLGDFFEYWVGDDAVTAFHRDIAERLKALSARTSVFLMVGNRDFALGTGFAAQCGASLLEDPFRIRLGSHHWRLSHGDTLCTDDKAYQRYRRVIRNPMVLALLLRLPRAWRLGLAEKLRANSRQRYRQGRTQPVDVNDEAVLAELHGAHVHGLIHGHTHLADWHQYRLKDGSAAERLVLGDWHEDGWYIRFEGDDITLNRFSIADPAFAIEV